MIERPICNKTGKEDEDTGFILPSRVGAHASPKKFQFFPQK
jgi:hypothetical protein